MNHIEFRARRKKIGLSILDISQKTAVDFGQISRWETRNMGISKASQEKIFAFLRSSEDAVLNHLLEMRNKNGADQNG